MLYFSESHGGNGRIGSTTYGSGSFGNDRDIVEATEDGIETSSSSVVSETVRENRPEKVKPPIPPEDNTRAPESSSHSVLHSTDNEFTKSTEFESLSSDSSTSHTGYRTTGSSESSDLNSPTAAGLPMSSTMERPKDDQYSESSDETSLAESETTSHSTSTSSVQTTDHVFNAPDEHPIQNYRTTGNDFDSRITSKASAGTIREEEENKATTIRTKSNLLEPENTEEERATLLTISENTSDRKGFTGATSVSKITEADEFSAEFPDITDVHSGIVTKLPLAEAGEFSGETPGSHETNSENIADKTFQINSKDGATVASQQEGSEHRSSLVDETRGTTLKTRTESIAKYNEDVSEESRSENKEQRTADLRSVTTENENLSTMMASVDSQTEKGSVRSDLSLKGSNRNVGSLSTPSASPLELLEQSEKATKESNRFENGNDNRTSVQSSSAKSGTIDRIGSVTASNVEKAFSTVNDEQDHIRTTYNEDNGNTDGFEFREQPSREEKELITTDPNQPAITGLNVQDKDENESTPAKTKQDHAASAPVGTSSKTNRHLGNEHSREQTAPHFDDRSTLAEESFSTETEIGSTLPSKETVEGTTKPSTENAASIITTPHTFEVSISVNDATESTETFVTPTLGTSLDSEFSSEDIGTADRSTSVTSRSSSGSSFPSFKEQHTSLNSGALTQDSEPIGAKGANEITFVNIPSTPEEFLEMPRAESGEALVNVENRRSFIETSRHAMRVWPSGKAMSKTTVQNSDLKFDFDEDERSILPEITTTSAERSSAHDFDIQVTESASQTSAILSNSRKIGTLQNHATIGGETEKFDEQTKEHIDAASSRLPLFLNDENAAMTSPNINTIQGAKTNQQGGSAEKLGRDGEVSSLNSQSTYAIADQMDAVLNSRSSRLQNQHYESTKTAIPTPATIPEAYNAVSPASEAPSSTASSLVTEENNSEVNTFHRDGLVEDHKGTSSGIDFDKTANGRASSANAELQPKHFGGDHNIKAHNKVATDRSDVRERSHTIMSALPLVSDVHATKTFENAKGGESAGSLDLTVGEEAPNIATNKMISEERVETDSLSDATKAHGAYLGGTMHEALQKGNRKSSFPSSHEDEEAKSGGLVDFPSFRSRNFDNSMSSHIPSNEVLEQLSGTDRSSLSADVADSSPSLPISAYGRLSTQHPEKLRKPQGDFAESAKQAKQNSTRRISLSRSSVYPCIVDLIIAIDYEPSITDDRENTARFMRRIMSNWTLSDNAIRVAIVSYGLDDGVGIYLDGFTNSRTEAAEALKYSLESGGGGVGVVYPLSRLFKSLYLEYSTPRNVIRFDDDSTRKDSRVRDNTRVIFLIFSDSSNKADIKMTAENGLCSKMFHDCRVLMVEMENG
ncbi:hypothetical protein Tcan_18251 [Toxocara canis]|uniref:VWFA domain-containing protein n=1 Tax=Toxocara canis TaxID=6265 RepID=A0A0B2UVA8_TOXCA|nr:hypothetical protein Tcan_18251 [Toxocara canis]